jgi:hypothetical protein
VTNCVDTLGRFTWGPKWLRLQDHVRSWPLLKTSPLVYERLYVYIVPLYTNVFRFKYMFNVSIREWFSFQNVFIVCIRNTVVFKLIPLLCTHVYSYMFSTVHPPRGSQVTESAGSDLKWLGSWDPCEPALTVCLYFPQMSSNCSSFSICVIFWMNEKISDLIWRSKFSVKLAVPTIYRSTTAYRSSNSVSSDRVAS